jgi:FixJ family two-component response regulator
MSQHRFTIADDDPDALFLLHRMIEKMYPSSSVATFSNAEDALAHIRDTGTDILITNHGMGKMSGTELIRTLRAQKVDIPIVMVSGNPEVRKEAEEAGANAFVEKTLDTKSIRDCIRGLLPD